MPAIIQPAKKCAEDGPVVGVVEALPKHSATAANFTHKLTPALNQEQRLRLISLIGIAPILSVPIEDGRFFCTFCCEAGIGNVWNKKRDWKQHEEGRHDLGLEWHCEKCPAVFYTSGDFKMHLRSHHNMARFGNVKIVQRKRLYACGFEHCRELNYNCKDYHDHIAIHMGKGHSHWSYSRTVRNLLNHTGLSEPWRTVCRNLGPVYNVTRNQLQWDSTTTKQFRRQLEYFDFGDSFPSFLQNLFVAGASKNGRTETG